LTALSRKSGRSAPNLSGWFVRNQAVIVEARGSVRWSGLNGRESLRRLVLLLALTPLALGTAFAQSWPSRPIQALVPQSAGSALDIVARAVFERISAQLGQPMIVENRVGAGNTIAMAAVARAEPDGHTILVNSSTHSLVPVTYTTLPFDTFRDLTPIIPLGNMPMVLVVSKAKGYRDLAEFAAAAKAKGGAMNYASGGTGSITHLAMEAFRLAVGFEAVHIPFKGAPEAITDVLAERVDCYFAPLTAALALLKDGRLQALAVSGSQRATAMPEVPTIGEAGFPSATYNFWVGVFVPSKTPAALVERLDREIATALESPVLKERFARIGVDPMPLDRARFAQLIQDEFVLNTKVAKAAGVKAN
jgi:tripartite-type tricarboxylate transporter receptor subunit TctC